MPRAFAGVNKIYWLSWDRKLCKHRGSGVPASDNDPKADGQPADINHLEGGPIASDQEVFDRWAGVEASDLPFDEIANLRPEVDRQMALHVDHPMYVKVHDACTRNAQGQLLFPPDVTGGVLYLIRYPLDVAVSYAHHGGRTLPQQADTLGNPKGNVYEMPDRMSLQSPQRLMSWSDHVRSWWTIPARSLW